MALGAGLQSAGPLFEAAGPLLAAGIPFDPISALLTAPSIVDALSGGPSSAESGARSDTVVTQSSPFIVGGAPAGETQAVVGAVAPILIAGLAIWALVVSR